MEISEIKKFFFLKLKNHILKDFLKIKGVISVNLVGSFWENPNENNFRDIDIVIILKEINRKKFYNCIKFIKKIDLNLFGLKDYKIKVNTTFGPLKFDFKKTLIFHLMVYDEKSHKEHVVKSPFTCFDWERTKHSSGKKLKDIFPVSNLQFNDFLYGRRSIKDYQKDLKKNKISYREYYWIGNKAYLKKKYFTTDNWHKTEYLYHIIKNILINYYKLLNQKNILPNDKKIKDLLIDINKNKFKNSFNNYLLLRSAKKNKIHIKTESLEKWVFKFMLHFQEIVKKELKKKLKVIFIRHAKTKLNDGSFLGINRDPEITLNNRTKEKIQKIKNKKILLIYTSEMKRSKQTSKLLNKKINMIINKNLNEKNYGDAEGLKYSQLNKKYPYLLKSWAKKKDPKFPNGESDTDVLKRFNIFTKVLIKKLNKIKNSGFIFVISHNVFLRNIIGNQFGIKKFDWHKIKTDHLVPFEFVFLKKKLISNIDRKILMEKNL